MTNLVAAVTLLIQTNNGVVIPNPTGLSISSNYSVVTSHVISYSAGGVNYRLTNVVNVRKFTVETKEIIPELPPIPNQPRKP